jgi:hypothetical protein
MEQVLPRGKGRGVCAGWGGRKVLQIMYKKVSKCKNDKVKLKKNKDLLNKVLPFISLTV